MYALVRFSYNGKIDEPFIRQFFDPCPKVGSISRFRTGALVVFRCPEDELVRELQTFIAPDGLFQASWGELTETIEPAEWREAIDNRLAQLAGKRWDDPPCGSNCSTCPQYSSNCRGCPVTPFYLGGNHSLR